MKTMWRWPIMVLSLVGGAGQGALGGQEIPAHLELSIGVVDGPEEMTTPGGAWIEAESEFVVFDVATSRRTRFGFDGRLVGTERVDPLQGIGRLLAFLPLRNGYSMGITTGDVSPQPHNHDPYRRWVILRGSTVVDTAASFRVPLLAARWQGEHGPAIRTLRVGPGLAGSVAVSGDSLLAVVDGRVGEVRYLLVTEEGLRGSHRSSLGMAGQEVLGADRRSMEALIRETRNIPRSVTLELDAPDHWPVATEGIFSDDGSLWVRTHPERDGTPVWRILDPTGRLLEASITFPDGFTPTAVRGQRLVGRFEDDLGVNSVRVYRLETGGEL